MVETPIVPICAFLSAPIGSKQGGGSGGGAGKLSSSGMSSTRTKSQLLHRWFAFVLLIFLSYSSNGSLSGRLLGRHGSASLCRVEREKKMAATYNVLAFKR